MQLSRQFEAGELERVQPGAVQDPFEHAGDVEMQAFGTYRFSSTTPSANSDVNTTPMLASVGTRPY